MVTRPLVIAATMLLTAPWARADIDFTPRESEYEMESVRLRQIAFSDGNGRAVTYQQPPGWSYSGNAMKLTMHPAIAAQAEGTITKVVLAQPGAFDEQTTKRLLEEALASAPKGSSDVTLVSQEINPLRIAGKDTFLVIIAYIFNGENYECSMMFLNRGNEQLRFHFVSRAASFKGLQRAFLASQATWQNI